MILPDTNLLIFATDTGSLFHPKASVWWEDALNSGESVGLPWSVALGFLRLSTKRAAMIEVLSLETAARIVRNLYAIPHVIALEPGPRHLDLVESLLLQAGTGGNLVADAHLAALAIEHRATLCSHDRDFQRFSGFSLFDPLA